MQNTLNCHLAYWSILFSCKLIVMALSRKGKDNRELQDQTFSCSLMDVSVYLSETNPRRLAGYVHYSRVRFME